MQDSKPHILDFGEPEKENSIIKVIGVGGGGGNAVNHMYREGIHDVSFVLCNTDNQALNDSPVPVHLQLGKEGLEPATNLKRQNKLQKKHWKTSNICLMMVPRWLSLLPVWAEEQVLELLLSLHASAKNWAY